MNETPLVIGVGNRMRRDDGAGPAVLDALGETACETAEVAGDGTRLIDLWDGKMLVHVVDAMRSGAPVGNVVRLDGFDDDIPRDRFPNTSHVFGIAEAIAMARQLGRRPQRLIVWGIEGGDFSHGAPLSPDVAAAVLDVANRIAAEFETDRADFLS